MFATKLASHSTPPNPHPYTHIQVPLYESDLDDNGVCAVGGTWCGGVEMWVGWRCGWDVGWGGGVGGWRCGWGGGVGGVWVEIWVGWRCGWDVGWG